VHGDELFGVHGDAATTVGVCVIAGGSVGRLTIAHQPVIVSCWTFFFFFFLPCMISRDVRRGSAIEQALIEEVVCQRVRRETQEGYNRPYYFRPSPPFPQQFLNIAIPLDLMIDRTGHDLLSRFG
jgi:hypothetical protein